MRRSLPFALLLFAIIVPARSTTWQVGPGRQYPSPSSVATLVGNGDTVAIDAGVYEADVARWSADNLVLRGVGGYAHLKANGTVYGGKAIWVISGNNTTVDSIEFSLAACPDRNGAGIRQEGAGLTVRGCRFHHNQNGILAGDNPASDIIIEHSEFDMNGFNDGYSHNLYINHVNSLTFRFNYSHHAMIGHELKSRAHRNYILYNRIGNEADGTASREIDLPNGGLAVIIGNEIMQGPRGENSNIIGYGLEGLTNPTEHSLYLVNNTIVNEKGAGSFVSIQSGTALYRAYNNIMAGPGTPLLGDAAVIDTSSNLVSSVAGAGFVAASSYDYHLLSGSPAVDGGTEPGQDGAYALAPDAEYLHPLQRGERASAGRLDIGAHEYRSLASAPPAPSRSVTLRVVPNPMATSATVTVTGIAGPSTLIIYSVTGEEIQRRELTGDEPIVITRGELPGGIYFGRVVRGAAQVAAGTIIVE